MSNYKNNKKGFANEYRAKKWLENFNYEIVDFKAKHGWWDEVYKIDLIAKKNNITYLFQVKTWSEYNANNDMGIDISLKMDRAPLKGLKKKYLILIGNRKQVPVMKEIGI